MDRSQGKQDVVVIGGGPGGYVAALRAAQLGGKVTLIEREKLGGTCLNVGCIPTKALLHCAQLALAPQEGRDCGIHLSLQGVDWDQVLAYQRSVMEKLVGGVGALLRKAGVEVVSGTASFLKPRTLRIVHPDGSSQIREAGRIIIAAGSEPVIPPIGGLKESRRVLTSTQALSLPRLPRSMVIIGGGVIGLELAWAFQALGCEITIVEALPRIAPSMDGELAGRLADSMRRRGITLLTDHKVTQVRDLEEGVEVSLQSSQGERTLCGEALLCAVGRRPSTQSLDLQAGGIACERGRILTDERQQTNVPGVYAVGDCTSPLMLAHVASAQGEIAAENVLGGQAVYRPACVPGGVYGPLELAGVGLTEEQAREMGIPFHVGRFPLSANGRALIANGGEGMVKVIVGDELEELLGIHILGPNATELISEGTAAISLEGTADDLIAAIHPHPTLSEALREAVLAAQGRPIHTIQKETRGAIL